MTCIYPPYHEDHSFEDFEAGTYFGIRSDIGTYVSQLRAAGHSIMITYDPVVKVWHGMVSAWGYYREEITEDAPEAEATTAAAPIEPKAVAAPEAETGTEPTSE